MATSGYDIPQSSPLVSRYEARRSSGSISGNYDVPHSPNVTVHRRTPSPSNSRRGYDSYLPPRSAQGFREEPNGRRPNVYRPEYPSRAFYGTQAPVAERYSEHLRPVEPDHWERPSVWQGGYNNTKPTWQERDHIPSPTGSTRSRGRDDMMASRMVEASESRSMLEPSFSWKQGNSDRQTREDGPHYPSDRYYEPNTRIMDSLSDPYLRTARSNAISGGDRYRPTAPGKRASFPNLRSDYDAHRPYENKRENRIPSQREPSPSRTYRGVSTPSSLWHPFESPPGSSRFSGFVSRSRSRSPEWRMNGGMLSSSSPQRQDCFNGCPKDDYDVSTRKELSRRSSRSSIASTQVSDAQLIAQNSTQRPDTPDCSSRNSDKRPLSSKSSVASSTFTDAQAILASRLKANLHPLIPSPSPLSSAVVTAEGNAFKPPAGATGDETQTNGHILTPPLSVVRPTLDGPSSAISNLVPDMSKQSPVIPKRSESIEHKLGEEPFQLPQPARSLSPPPGLLIHAAKMTIIDTNSPSPPVETPAKSIEHTEEPPVDKVPRVEESVVAEPPQATPQPSAPPLVSSPFRTVPKKPASAMQSPVLKHEELTREPQVLLKVGPLFPSDAPPVVEKPSLAGAKSMAEALRAVVMTRLLCDRQTREELVNPVLMANQALVTGTLPPQPTSKSTPDELITEVQENLDATVDYETVRPCLADHFEERQSLVNDKVQRLSVEYISLHKRWKAHCASLNAQSRIHGQDDYLLHGRTTRRTTAFTDTVRSDLEMEQVIASLGVEDLTDAHYLSSRNAATIPDMISVVEGKVDYLFDDTNHYVETPADYYAPHTGIDDWTEEEKRVFIDKFAMYPKQFGLIADHIPYKTAAQCVDYYYLHKKRLIDFRKVVSQLAPNKRKRRGGGKKKGNALLADIAQHDAEVGKDHLSTFIVPSRVAKGKRKGRAAAAIAASASKAQSSTPMASATPQPEMPPAVDNKSTPEVRRLRLPEDTPVATPTPEPEGRSRRTRKPPAPVTILVPPPPPAPPVVLAPRAESISAPPVEQDKPVKKAKRQRKQVKSAAIITDEPASPPPEEIPLAPSISANLSTAAIPRHRPPLSYITDDSDSDSSD